MGVNRGGVRVELISEESADGLVFRLSGEIDLSQARELSESILRVLAAGRDLVVELSDVSYIDSSGISALIEGHQMAEQERLSFSLAQPSPAVLKVIQMARLDRVFKLEPSSL